jgi:hypothetical protein
MRIMLFWPPYSYIYYANDLRILPIKKECCFSRLVRRRHVVLFCIAVPTKAEVSSGLPDRWHTAGTVTCGYWALVDWWSGGEPRGKFLLRFLCGWFHGALTVSDYRVLLVGERYTWKSMEGSGRGLLEILYQYVQGIEENYRNSRLG